MDNKKILEDAREKIRNGNISEADKSMLGDILGVVAGMANSNSGGRPDNSNLLNQIQSLANLVGMTGSSSSGKPDVGNIIQNIAGVITSESNQSARTESSSGKTSGRKPQGLRRNEGRVASVARNVADQLRERNS